MADHLEGRHIPFLVEHLSKVAYKWRDIGTALEFKSQDLRNIEASPSLIATAPSSFTQRLVEEWLEGKYPHTVPPTLANLLKALNSHTVGLGTLAAQIRDSLPQHDHLVEAKVFEIASVSDEGNITFNRSEVIRVNENMLVCLKVKVNPKEQMCRWSHTKLASIYDGMHSDRDTPTLCISRTDIDMDGSQYLCNIIIKKQSYRRDRYQHIEVIYPPSVLYHRKLTTTPVTLRVGCLQLDQFKESLAAIYLAQPEVPRDSWPPVSSKIYINLALVKQQAMNYCGEYARLTIRGDMDDILHHKEKIEYENIFDGLKSGSLLLIEGRPGSGKTTFVHKVTRDWATNEVQGPMRLVLLVSLRVLNSWEKPVTLEDILKLLDFHENEKLLKDRKGKGVCFIFDGLDEFSPLEGKDSIIYKIINKIYLPQSITIVASRPAALVNLRQRADRVIEIIGFPKDQIFEYVNNYPFSNTPKAKELKSYLLSHPNVLHMCYLPIHAAMVAFLFEVMGKIPRTETEIYTHFTRFTLMRSLSKHKEQGELEDMDTSKLSGEEKELFDTICKFALSKTISKKQVLDEGEVKLHLQSKDCKDISLGLVTVDRTAGLYGFKNIYTFLHLTYQEYLAAHHISTLSDEDQHKLIKEHGDMDHMQVVWKFYFGLVNFEGHENKIKALVGRKRDISLSDIQCAYESQQKVVCDCFMKEMDAQIILEDKYLTTSDFTALGYLLANSPIPISLSLTNCNMNTEAFSALLKETGGKPLCLCALSYVSHDIDLEILTKLLSQQHSLECLKISSRTTRDADHFYNIIDPSLANLKELSLINVRIDPTTLRYMLKICKELSFLSINTSIESFEPFSITENNLIEALLSEVTKCKKLERVTFNVYIIAFCHSQMWCTIDLTRNGTDFDLTLPDIQEDSNSSMLCIQGVRGNYLQTLMLEYKGADFLQGTYFDYWPLRPKLLIQAGLARNILPSDFSALEKLILNNTNIDTKHFAKKLSHCMMLQELEITYGQTKVIPERIMTILASLRGCSNLQKLVLTNIDIKLDDACVLAFCLQHWPKLQGLHLRGCGIEEEGAKAIADNIKCCPELTEVDLSDIGYDIGYDITSVAVEGIIKGLKSCPNLKKLVLNNRYIKTDDACILASYLQHWPKLQELHLRGCGIEEEGAKAIADNIKHCPELTDVDLMSEIENDTSDSGVDVLPMCYEEYLFYRQYSDCICQEWPHHNPHKKHFRNDISNETLKLIKSSLQSHKDATNKSQHQSQQPCNEVTGQSHHPMSGSQQPHDDNVTDQGRHQIPKSQQPLVPESSQKDVSGVSKKGGRRVREKKWRKPATIADDIPLCKRPKLSPQGRIVDAKLQDFVVTSQNTGLLESLHADSHNKPETSVEPQNPIRTEVGPPQNDHVTVIGFGSKNIIQDKNVTEIMQLSTQNLNETEAGNQTQTTSESSYKNQAREETTTQ